MDTKTLGWITIPLLMPEPHDNCKTNSLLLSEVRPTRRSLAVSYVQDVARGNYVFNFEANCFLNLTTFGPTTAVQ
jgi:hypothetical protein